MGERAEIVILPSGPTPFPFPPNVMSTRSIGLSEPLHEYLIAHAVREPEVLRRLREETAQLPEGQMQIAPEQGQLMALLVRLMGVQRALEVGVFTGYSSLSVALALPDDGRLVACDVSEEYTSVAQRYWHEARVSHKIELHLGPAVETLDALLIGGQAGTFDFAFIDADKTEYEAYYERALHLVRHGGLIALDNMFMGGRVADPSVRSPGVDAIRSLNEHLRTDDRIDLALVPVADGLTLARKR